MPFATRGADVTTFASQVRDRRKALSLTQDSLADLAECSPRFVRAIEAGKVSLRLDKLVAVLDALGLELTTQLRLTS
jgi:HTH-type transcriptional regulator / antitoxin HipB